MEWLQVALLLVISIAMVVYISWRAERWAALLRHGAALLEAGDLSAAQCVLEAAEGHALRAPEHVLARLYLGCCALFQGRVDTARSELLALSRGWRTWEAPDAYAAAPDMLAACLALEGELVEARHWLEIAHRRHRPVAATFSLGEVLILCREECYGAAVRLLDDRLDATAKKQVQARRLFGLLRAFAWDALTAEGGASGEEQKGLDSVRPGEFSYLGAQWPRMAAFLRARGLSEREADGGGVVPAISQFRAFEQ